jgi:hypothetical protein
MSRCLFCLSILTRDTKPEHVLLNGLGGKKRTRRVICSSCNEALGSKLDDELCESVKEIRNLLDLPKGDGSPAPMIRRDDPAHGHLVLKPGGLPVSSDVVFDVQQNGPQVEFKLSVGTREKLAELLPHVSRRLRITDEQARDILKEAHFEERELYLTSIYRQLSLGTEGAHRSIAKMCLVLLASCIGVERVHTFDIQRAVEYVVSGKHRADVSIGFQSAKLPIQQILESRFGRFFNGLIVRVTSEGRLYGYFCLYNGISWLLALGRGDAQSAGTYCLFSNPQHPSAWSEEDFGATAIDDGFFATSDASNIGDVYREFVVRMMKAYRGAAHRNMLADAADEVTKEMRLQPDQALSEYQVHEFFGRVSDRIALQFLRRPISRRFGLEE